MWHARHTEIADLPQRKKTGAEEHKKKTPSKCIFFIHLSVVGSGPTLWPGKSLFSKERMKLVLPTLYCPTISTIGFASKSAGFIGGEWKCAKRLDSSNGMICGNQ